MNKSNKTLLRVILSLMCCVGSFHSFAQLPVELTPVVVSEPQMEGWNTYTLPFWNAEVKFPEEPTQYQRDIYTEKGLTNQTIVSWNNKDGSLFLEASYYKLPENLTTKNEKRLLESVVNKIAVAYNGYPQVGEGTIIENTIRGFELNLKTLKGEALKARILMKGNQVLILKTLTASNSAEVNNQLRYFLKSFATQADNFSTENQTVHQSAEESQQPLIKWDTLSVENFYLTFPKAPLHRYKALKINNQTQDYYEWNMRDAQTQTTYLLALIPLNNFPRMNLQELVNQSVKNSLRATGAQLEERRILDYFKYPMEEVWIKTKLQTFRMRYFSDGKYLYQLLVSGNADEMNAPNSNRFLDGLRWIE